MPERGVKKLSPILIAEDDENDFFFFERRVRDAGVKNPVLRFDDGAQTIAYLQSVVGTPQELRPSLGELLFLDIKMPNRDGFEVLAWAKAQRELSYLRIVMLSGSGLPQDVKKAASLGAERYFVKYPNPDELLSVISSPATARASVAEQSISPPA